jgi:hypothetical protein
MLKKFKNYFKLLIIGIISIYSIDGNAQLRAMMTPSLEIPIVFSGNPGYKIAPGIKLGGFYEARRLSIGLSVGYQSFSSSEGTLNRLGLSSFQLDDDPTSSSSSFGSTIGNRSCDTCTYTAEFGDLTMIPILIEWNQYLLKINKLKFSLGLNVGIRIYSYSHVITFDEPLEKLNTNGSSTTQPELIKGVITTDKKDTRFNVSPKVVFEYLITYKFSLYIESAINLQSEGLGDFFMINDSFGSSFSGPTPNSYTVDQMFTASIGLGIIYNFGYPAEVRKRNYDANKIMESEKIEWLPE